MAGKAVIIAAVLLLLASPQVLAQQRGDVVVTARPRQPEEVVRRKVRAITRRTGDQVSRFSEPVCAGTIGLPEPYAQQVVDRIMADARAAGVPTDRPGCRPNVTLVIVDDGRQLLRELKRQGSRLGRALPDREVERALAEPGPARVVTATQIRSRDGDVPSGDYSVGNRGPAGGASTMLVRSASIITLSTRQDITGSLVLVDTAGAMGRTLTQLADYAAMRALAKTNAAGDADSILSLFTAPAPPRRLTAFDAAFLRALYHGPPTTTFNEKIGQMARQIAEDGR